MRGWSKTESITAIYMSNKSGSWKQSPSDSQIYINLVHPVDPIQYLHMCKGIQYNKWKVKSLNTPDLAFVWQTGQEAKGLPPPPSWGWRKKSGQKWLYPSSSAQSLEDKTYFESKLWCSWTESHKYHILEAKQRGCPAVQTGVLTLIYGMAVHNKAPQGVG